MLSDLREASDAKLPPPSCTPAPRVRFVQTEAGQTIGPGLDETDPEVFRGGFVAALGTTEPAIAEALFQDVLNLFHTDPAKSFDIATVNFVLALLHRIGPSDELEAMFACQMIAAHVSAMDATRRGLHIEQTTGGRAVYLSLARKLMTLFAAQMDALNRHRGKGTTQKIVIERVLVAPGGQAVVGSVSGGGRGDG